MIGDDDQQPGPPPGEGPDEQRTIFNPQVRGVSPAAPREPSADAPKAGSESDPEPWGTEEAASAPSPAGDEWGGSPEPAPEPVPVTRPTSATISSLNVEPIRPQPHAQGIKVGDVLNHIFEITRFIARGGMGEVFEAVNVNSDEKVAVKVMLPSLAADPNVIGMFRREARTMTRLNHEALVQYRVMAQEPQLGVLYIVTEFIDGVPLGDVLGTLKPDADDLEMLLRRLAAGMAAAHRLGALHRDLSPDNVLLEGGRLSSAKVIDFGIAKDLNPGTATIIGDGFAGKLGYVAPEQLGDFDRELGPWTDVYSLGLVMLAAAIGRDVQMGGTLVDAVDKRRQGPDLTLVPERVRPVIAGMLKPNPKERYRSMDEIIVALDEARTPLRPEPVAAAPEAPKNRNRNLVIGGVAAALLLGGGAMWLAGGDDETAATQASGGAGAGAARPGDPVESARGAINSAIPSIVCSWLDIVNLAADKGQVNVGMGGVAGSPAAAQTEIAGALSSAGAANANIDFAAVAPIQPGGCAAIDAYRQMRNSEAPRLATDQRKWEISRHDDTGNPAGPNVARVIIRVSDPGADQDMTLFGIEPSGKFGELLGSRADFDSAASSPQSSGVSKRDGGYELQLDLDHQGWSGLIFVTGKGPFQGDVLRPELGARNVAWKDKLLKNGSDSGWKADMLWIKTVDEKQGD